MTTRKFWVCALLAVLASAAANPVYGQVADGTIAGKVILEATGSPVHGASIVVIGARRTVTSGEDGTFSIANVPAGTYEVLAQRDHFSAARQVATVTAGQTTTLEFKLSIENVHEEVTVTASATGTRTTFDAFNAITSLDTLELAKSMGTTLADALANTPGVAKRSFGPASSRPIIRGFDGDRVLIMQDGVRTGDLSSQSGDHGVSIDPGGLERLEVVKGPATLLYGSNAIGGVVNAITPQDAFRSKPFTGILGGVTVDGSSANEGAGGNASLQYGRNNWTLWGGGGARRTGDYDTPAGRIANSAARSHSGRLGFGYAGARGFFSVGGTVEDSRFGIPFAGLFEGEPDAEVDIDSLRRDIRSDFGAQNLTSSFVDAVRVTLGFTDYSHRELEIEDGEESVGTSFSNKTFTSRAEVEQKRRGRLSGRLGAELTRRDFSSVGAEALAPAVDQTTAAAFVYEEAGFNRWRLQVGGRFEHSSYAVEPRASDAPIAAPAVRDRSFSSVSGSVGVHANLGASGAFVVNLSGASRAPALEELYNFGPHIGNLTFEIGNPELRIERTLGADVSLRSRAANARGEVNAFVYRIKNFVFLDFTGEIEDGLRVANYVQANSQFIGVEASGTAELGSHLHLRASASYVRATLRDSNEFLPRIPPFSARVDFDIPWGKLTVNPEVVFTAAQKNVFRDETTTAGSTVFGLGATYIFGTSHATHTFAVKAYNLTNEEYRLHNSLLKDFAPEIGRGVKLTYSVKFF
jgi:iron complex outermembrane receptor protein